MKSAQAVAAYRDVLKERTRERVPLEWAATQDNLGAALQKLGEREAQTDKAKAAETLKAALDHYVGALEESRKAGATYYEEVARSNIAEFAARFSVKDAAQ